MAGFRRPSDSGKSAVAVFATLIMFVYGIIACVMIVLTFNPDNSQNQLALVVVLFGVAALVLNALRPRSDSDAVARLSFWSWLRKDHEYEPDLQVRRKETHQGPYGTNKPPTLDEVREMQNADYGVKWTPGRTRRS